MEEFQFKVGDRVVVEISGTVEVCQVSRRGTKYIIQPYDQRAAAVHAEPQFVFPEDDEPELCAEVIPFPRPSLPPCLAEMVEADVA